jgi:hypothetical protein
MIHKLIINQKLIERVLYSYVVSPTYCYGNCSGNGACVDTGYFQFGMCKCKDEWSGTDCSVAIIRPSVLSGTLCAHESDVACDGFYQGDIECNEKIKVKLMFYKNVTSFFRSDALNSTFSEDQRSEKQMSFFLIIVLIFYNDGNE